MHTRRLPVTLTLIAIMLITLIGGAFSVAAATPAASQASAQQAAAPSAAAVTPGNVYAWGYNNCGQVGDGSQDAQFNFPSSYPRCNNVERVPLGGVGAAEYNDRAVPYQVVNIGQVVDVASGREHSLAVTSNGEVYAWGNNNVNQLGIGQEAPNGDNRSYGYPVPVVKPCTASPAPGITPTPNGTPVGGPGACGYLGTIVAVAAGQRHSLALSSTGVVYAWGDNALGQLGTPLPGNSFSSNRPVQVVGLTNIIAIAAGESSSYALSSTGVVYAWGADGRGQAGDGNADNNPKPAPVQVVGIGGITAIAASAASNHALALRGSDGAVFAWGANGSGQLGNNDPGTDQFAPTQVSGVGNGGLLVGVQGIAAGATHSLAILNDGSVLAWGANGSGNLGDGTTTQQNVPVRVQGPNGVGNLPPIAQVAAGDANSLALTADGRVYSWGYGEFGQAGDGLRNPNNLYPVAVRSANGPGQLGGIARVAGGGWHVLAIASATATPDPTGLAFGEQPVGTVSAVQNVTITNAGGGPLSVTGVTIGGTNAGDFTIVGGCPAIVAPGSSCTVGVAFTPTAVDARGATLSFATSAGQADVALTGTGTAAAPSTFNVTASVVGQGTITPVGVSNYQGGTIATYTAAPAAGQVFLGWTLDGTYVGYASPLTFTVNANRTLVATFAPRPAFSDVPSADADWQAITFLAAFGIVNPQGVNGSGQFQPTRGVLRAEVAAFIARTFGWQKEFHRNTFPDRCDPQSANCVDDELWNNVAALADYGVVGGYTDAATCASAGTTAPCYLPRDTVNHLQVVSIVARSFIKTPDLRPTGFWERLAAVAGQYTNVPASGTQRSDLATYRANAGAIPTQASDATFPDPNGPSSRRFVIAVLYQAFNAVYSVDRVP